MKKKKQTGSTEEIVILWEAPKIDKPEFRLYYDENGKVITYTCDKLLGKYIVVDAVTFSQARHDIRVVDEKIVNLSCANYTSKLKPNDESGAYCLEEDISIVVNQTDSCSKTRWRLEINEC